MNNLKVIGNKVVLTPVLQDSICGNESKILMCGNKYSKNFGKVFVSNNIDLVVDTIVVFDDDKAERATVNGVEIIITEIDKIVAVLEQNNE